MFTVIAPMLVAAFISAAIFAVLGVSSLFERFGSAAGASLPVLRTT